MKPFFEKNKIHFIALLIFSLITIGFFAPVFDGKTIYQGDTVNAMGMSQELKEYHKNTGEYALWTNSMFSGMPAFMIYHGPWGDLFRPVFLTIYNVINMNTFHFLLYLLGFYFLMHSFQSNPWVGIIAAISYAFSTYFIIIIEAGHVIKHLAVAYFPFLIGSTIWLFKSDKKLKWTLITGILWALELRANHPQMTYYFMFVYGSFMVGKIIHSYFNKETISSLVKISSLSILAICIGLLSNFYSIYSNYEYSKQTIRGKSELTLNKTENSSTGLEKDYITAWSYGISESFTLLIPNFKGGGSGAIGESNKEVLKEIPGQYKQSVAGMDPYFGNQPFTSGPVYAGAIVCFLFVLSLFLLKGYLKWSLLLAGILSLMLSWGKNFMGLTDIFIDYFPLYNKFRAVASILVNVEFILPVLAFVVLHKIIKNEITKEIWLKPLYYSTLITAGFCLLCIIMPETVNTFEKENEIQSLTQRYVAYGQGTEQEIQRYLNEIFPYVVEARIEIFKSDALRSFLLILFAFGFLLIYAKNIISQKILLLGLGLLVFFDLWSVNKRYLNDKNFVSKKKMEKPFDITPADEQILADKDIHYRVYNTTMRPDQDSRTSYFHKSLGGYHGAKLKRYQELIDFHFNTGNRQVFNMLNAKYYLIKDKEGNMQAIENPERLGNAWFVQNFQIVLNADSEITAMNDFNPKVTAIVDQRFESYVKGFIYKADSLAYIRLTNYKPDRLTYEFNSTVDQLTVFSEIYYGKDWKVTIDGKPAEHFRVNYVLRAMVIPEGKHTIEFHFDPEYYTFSNNVSLVANSILMALLLGTFIRPLFGKKALEQ